MKNCGEDVNEIDVKPDGSWRAKGEGECKDLSRWHLADGSLCAAMDLDVQRGFEISKDIKQEDISEGLTGLKLGMKKSQNGFWELSKPEDTRASYGNHVHEELGNHFQNLMPMSSSTSRSYNDGEDSSVNQDCGGSLDLSLNNVHELDSISLNFDPTYNIEDRTPPAPLKDADVIVLSDSDEEGNATMVSAKTDANGINFPSNQPGFEETYPEEPALKVNGPAFGPFSSDNDDFGMPMWQMPTYSKAGPTFQLFGADGNRSDALVDVQQNSVPSLNGYGLTSNGDHGETTQAQDPLGTELNVSLVGNPLAYGSNDPSLQFFLPSQPADPPQADLNGRTEIANGDGLGNWISLSLGGAGGGKGGSASSKGMKSSKQLFTAQENDTASFLLNMNGERGHKGTSNARTSDGPFSHPHQPRSVRPRLYLSIDSDSD